jgi:hypothetical protein
MKSLKQKFIKWLEQQPDDRKFEYSDNKNCLICNFFKESEGLSVGASADYYHVWDGEVYTSKKLAENPIPDFLRPKSNYYILQDACNDLRILKEHFANDDDTTTTT